MLHRMSHNDITGPSLSSAHLGLVDWLDVPPSITYQFRNIAATLLFRNESRLKLFVIKVISMTNILKYVGVVRKT